MNESEIRSSLDTLLDAAELEGADWIDNPAVQVYDWVLENNEDDLVADVDLEIFEKKNNEQQEETEN